MGRRRRKGGRIQKAKGANTEEKEKETEERMNVRRSRREAGAPRRGPRSDLAKSSQALAPKARRAVLDLARSAERGEGARIFF